MALHIGNLLKKKLGNTYTQVFSKMYYGWYYSFRIRKLRKQPIITVVFKIEDLGAWKTEGLYRLMLNHPRFDPKLFISRNAVEDDRVNLRAYCKAKGYDYLEIDGQNYPVWHYCYPDIVFFQKPYRDTFLGLSELIRYHKTLFAYITYGLHGSIEPWCYDWPYLHKCWQIYYENKKLAEEYGRLLNSRIPNSYATGLPMMDELLTPKAQIADQWKECSAEKKRIIFAPHHSINLDNEWITSTFLEMGDAILELAEQYSDKVQWAFKPHPLLREKLEKVWGKERTDKYYRRWSEASWSQFEPGKYMGLFKYSDAMIHDCGSFIMEYLYMDKPVMYLMRNENLADTFNSAYKKALTLMYHGWNIDDVENFIQNVISGNDSMKQLRDDFYREYMIPPNNTSASQNIIDCILYEDVAKRMIVETK